MPEPNGGSRPVRLADLLLTTASLLPMAHDVFSPEELEQVIEQHRQRILAGAPKAAAPMKTRAQFTYPDWLVIMNCSRCRRIIRPKRKVRFPRGTKAHTRVNVLSIPIVAGRVEGRPVCLKCKNDY